MGNNEITIVYASDEEYILQTFVSIYSVLASRKKKYHYVFFILMGIGASEGVCFPKWKFDNYSIQIIEVDDTKFLKVGRKIEHITNPTFFRLLIPELEQIGDKCLYLDGDTICCSDISELFNYDISNYCLAGVRPTRPSLPDLEKEREKVLLGIKSVDDYVNAGVLLMNVSRIRSKNIDVVGLSQYDFPYQDQDVINKAFFGEICILHPKFNLYSWANNFLLKNISLRYSTNELDEAIKNPCIIHYACMYTKPWKNKGCVLGDLWWKTAYCALNKKQVEKLKSVLNDNKYLFDDLGEQIKQYRKIYIWGAGKDGVSFVTYAKKNGLDDRIECFCDRAQSKIGTSFGGIHVYSPEVLKNLDERDCVVVASRLYKNEICDELREMKISEHNIFIYRKKTIDYYMSFAVVNDYDVTAELYEE